MVRQRQNKISPTVLRSSLVLGIAILMAWALIWWPVRSSVSAVEAPQARASLSMVLVHLQSVGFRNVKAKLRFKKTDRTWQPIPGELQNQHPFRPVRIELRQDPNTPPALYAIETATGRERMIRDLNPQLRKEVALGRVEMVHWKATDGRPWTGMLYYPVNYQPGKRYPVEFDRRTI